MEFKALGKTKATFEELETFAAPIELNYVECISDEVAACCPVTGQPDWYTVTIGYQPCGRCLESKSLKLFLQSFKDKGIFCEALAAEIRLTVQKALDARPVKVVVEQKARGGIKIIATSGDDI